MSSSRGHKWSQDEHERFLQALEMYPRGSWKQRAAHVYTRSARQVMTHAQKLALKAKRHARGLQKAGRPPGKNGIKAGGKHQPLKLKTPRRQNRRGQIHGQREEISAGAQSEAPLADTQGSFVTMLESPMVQIDMLCLYPLDECAHELLSPASPGAGVFSFDTGKTDPDNFDSFLLELAATV